jgi:hypothetical protein
MNHQFVEQDSARENLTNAIKAFDGARLPAALETIVDVFAIEEEEELLDEVLLAATCAGFDDGGDDERWAWNSAIEWWESNHG